MNFSQALDATLKKFDISGKWLSEQTGLSQQMISGFRKNKQRVYSDSLELMLKTLPYEGRQYFYSLVLGKEVSPEQAVAYNEAEIMSSKEVAELIRRIASELETKTSQNWEILEKRKEAVL